MRQFFFVLFCMFFTVSTFATSVTQDNAAKVAKNYFSEVLLSHGKNFTAAISESFKITKDGNTVLYVFNFEKGGYVIVSAEDRFTPIIGYSPDGYYEEKNMPGGFEFLMSEFSDMITFIRDKNISGEQQYTAKWERYQSDNYTPERGVAADVVKPLTALWNQDFPYNYFAPPVSDGPGGKGYAGCVATAMSIIMYYWRWPWEGTGSKSYRPEKCNGTTMPLLSENFGQAHYDYNGMFGSPTETADDFLYEPIALLQYHAGVAVNMNYCGDAAGGSGAQSANVPTAMKLFFKYHSSIQYVERKNYTNTAAWGTMMKEQLDLLQPVYVSGYSSGGGHAFVCDGYNSDNMFHYNFGWSGYKNGYFVSDKPSEFTSGVAAVINFIPDRAQGYPIDANSILTIPHATGTIEDCSGPVDNYAPGTISAWLIDPSVGRTVVNNITINALQMDLAPGDYLRIYDGEDELAPILGEFSGTKLFESKTSKGPKVLVKFVCQDASATAKGFMISYDSESRECCNPRSPITFTESRGKFTDGSPEDMNYNNNAGPCTWNIFPSNPLPETNIHIKFTRFETEAEKDIVRVINQNTSKVIATLSGTYAELPEYNVNTTRVRVTFTSNSYIVGKGFEIEYDASPLTITEWGDINSFAIYPNPVKDRLFVNFNTDVTDDYNITIYNVTGQAIYTEKLNNFVGDYSNTINFSEFAQGVYLMQIKSSKGMITRKIVR